MRRVAAVVLCTVVAAAALAACSDDDGPSDSGHSRVITGPTDGSIDPGQRDLLLQDLKAMNPALVADEDTAVDKADLICTHIEEGDADDAVTNEAAQEFAVTTDQAALIVESIRTTFCGG
jgi:hypothetical protein